MQLAIVTDYEYRAQMVDQIMLERGGKVLACVGQPKPRDWLAQYQGIDLVIVDLDVVASIQLLKELAHSLPQTPLVALATPQRIVELQEAFAAGAVDFVAFPIDVKHFLNTIERARRAPLRSATAIQRHETATPQPREMLMQAPAPRQVGKVIVLTSLKGGVGRSTLAANLAVSLRQQTTRDVIVTESHHGLGHLSLLLNLYPRHTLANLDGVAHVDHDIVQGLLQYHNSGVRLLSAPTDPAQLTELSGDIWKQTLKILTELAQHVVVDTSSNADAVLSEVLTIADEIIVVTGPDIASLRDTRSLLKSLRSEGHVNGRIHIVLNRAGVQGGIDERLMRDQLGEPVIASIPNDPALAIFSYNRGIPFVSSHPRSLLSRRVMSLAEHLTGAHLTTETKPAARRSPLAFLNLLR